MSQNIKGGGVKGHRFIWATGKLPPKLIHILGCLAFSKKPNTCQNTFENTMENLLFLTHYFLDKTLKFFFNSNHIGLDWKTASRINFGPREVPKQENMHFHFHAFSAWGTSRGSTIYSESSLLIKSYIITILIFFGVFCHKKLISDCIIKMWFERHRVLFLGKKNQKMLNTRKYA